MNTGSRPNIELGGVTASADAMTACVRHLAEPSAGHKHRHTAASKMPMIVSVAAADTSRSISPTPEQSCAIAPKRPPGMGVAGQTP
jgi:hypothetical protein